METTSALTYGEQYWAWVDCFGTTDRYEGLELYQLMVKTGEWLELIAGEEATNSAMRSLYREVVSYLPTAAVRDELGQILDTIEDASWREIWLDEEGYPYSITAGDLEHLPVAQKFTALHGFAFGGIVPGKTSAPEPSEFDKVRAEIKDLVEWGVTFLDLIPNGWPLGEHMRETILAASARFKLDELGENVSADELAALAGTGVKNIRNILSKKDGTLIQAEDGVTPESARAWLAGRANYFPSVYLIDDGSRAPEANREEQVSDAIFVPVSKSDGEPFLPSLRRAGKFTVGGKGEEIHIEDYFEALEFLKCMSVPKWRRPNSEGNWGLVSGSENWRRMSRRELEAYSSIN